MTDTVDSCMIQDDIDTLTNSSAVDSMRTGAGTSIFQDVAVNQEKILEL